MPKPSFVLVREPIALVASLGDDAKSAQTRELLEEIAELSDKVSARFNGDHERRPGRVGEALRLGQRGGGDDLGGDGHEQESDGEVHIDTS